MAQDLVVTEVDCGTENGLIMTAVIEGGDVVEGLGNRVLGRVIAVDVFNAAGDEVLIPKGTMIDEQWVTKIDAMTIDEIKVRSAITCDTRYGVCGQLLRSRSRSWTSR